MNWEVEPDPALEDLLEYIRLSRGVNFTGYKRSTLTRRIRKRMEQVKISAYADYTDFLEADADEFKALFDTILINVTGFFRDKPSWDFLAEEVIPKIVESKRSPGEAIRVWSAGCASGEEAYSVAMLLAESLGGSQLRNRVKIYATDIDADALEEARQGVYSAKAASEIPDDLRSRYMEQVGDRFAVRNGPRRAVIFGRHDLTRDAPIGRLDLLICRNTLMYFNSDLQTRILNTFHFALEPRGYLFLGKAEMLVLHGQLFNAANMKHRIFQRTEVALHRPPLPPVEDSQQEVAHVRDVVGSLLIEAAPIALLAVDDRGRLAEANAAAHSMLGVSSKDIGQPLQNLEVSYRPVDLRSRLERAYTERHTFEEHSVERVMPDGDVQYLDITVVPLMQQDAVTGVAFSFVDVTDSHKLHDELERSRETLETTYEELRSTNEELETTNEELQSSNEELETMNEELQSTNEELETTNEELRTRATEVADLNERLNILVSSLNSGVIALNREMLVELWNRKAEQWWGLNEEEVVGRPFATLDIGLPVGPLLPVIRECLYRGATQEDIDLEGFTRTGKPARMKVNCTPVSGAGSPSGVVLLVDLEGE